jgi:Holliday junction resolvase-like predicted endonuclease
MEVVKSNGKRVRFNPDKILRTLKRAGAKPELARGVLKAVTRQMRDGMTTREMHRMVRRELRRASKPLAQRYNLRDALLKLGPAGFKFEKYVASVLQAYQFETEIPEDEVAGLCVRHEIDVIARKEGRTVMIEAKFRNRFGDTVSLKDVMATWSSFLDLADGAKAGKTLKFDELWVVTNGRFSERALQFGVCRGIHLVGWGSEEHSLPRLVDHATLYPITIVDDLHSWELETLAAHNILLCREIAERDAASLSKRLKLPEDRVGKIVNSCRAVVSGG